MNLDYDVTCGKLERYVCKHKSTNVSFGEKIYLTGEELISDFSMNQFFQKPNVRKNYDVYELENGHWSFMGIIYDPKFEDFRKKYFSSEAKCEVCGADDPKPVYKFFKHDYRGRLLYPEYIYSFDNQSFVCFDCKKNKKNEWSLSKDQFCQKFGIEKK